MSVANDAQRVILLSCIVQIRALQAQKKWLKSVLGNFWACADCLLKTDPITDTSDVKEIAIKISLVRLDRNNHAAKLQLQSRKKVPLQS